MSALNLVSQGVLAPIDRTALTPPISFGADPINNSGTGIYGTMISISLSLIGVDALALSASGLKLTNNVAVLNGAGAPVDGTTGDDYAGTGSLYIDRTNGVLYINTGLITNPTWVTVGSQT